MNATQLNRARQLAGSGADYLKMVAPHHSKEDLENALAYAKQQNANKIMLKALEREIRKKEKGAAHGS
jgi:hypothetical protein